jgi:hypothetical protein
VKTDDIDINVGIQHELSVYGNALKQLPTIMRKLPGTSKSQPFRLLKSDTFALFHDERMRTDLLLASSIVDDAKY